MDAIEARTRFSELRKQEGQVSAAELDEIWAALDTVRPEEILGEWKGSEFHTGHPLNGQHAQVGWYGKTFVSVRDAKPAICRSESGELYSNIELGKGEASLWSVEFRGEVTAAMIYDGMPALDHLKRVDDTTLMAIMNGKEVPEDGPFFYFTLERTA
ncbi:DUF4334 domain-containing protein [Streptomyces natalensis]|uniref:GXWXG protein n=1 Tax=Streptomyces natalensis ATCC 27448 TaxID=1240678 RepID=A0A0D7CLM3_9ACTN|nr:DUF4334 domain-containing protein [Streptomyces natalensis]KIZ16991.1 hypothetical protein SNA_18715 [Streptomyces natalensis ATCC 27448]